MYCWLEITAAVLVYSTSCIRHCPNVLLSSASILRACQRGASGKAAAINTELITWQRGEERVSLTAHWDCAHYGVPLVIFAKSPSSQSGQVKTRACFSPLTFQFTVPVSVATSGTSSLDEEVFSTALQSNGNDCAPGETENCICVLEWSALMRPRGKHAWK